MLWYNTYVTKKKIIKSQFKLERHYHAHTHLMYDF